MTMNTPMECVTDSVEKNSEEVNSSSISSTSNQTTSDVNNYSRFENIDDPDLAPPLAACIAEKSEGNVLFKAGDYTNAVKKYDAALLELPEESKLISKETKRQRKVEKSKILLNRAFCYVKLCTPDDSSIAEKALKDCNQVLSSKMCDFKSGKEPTKEALELGLIKCLFRRGQAQEKLGFVEKAFRDFFVLLNIEKGHKQAMKAYKRLRPQIHDRSRKAIVASVNADIAAEKKKVREAAEKAEKEEKEKLAKARLKEKDKNRKEKMAPPPPTLLSANKPIQQERTTLTKSENKGYCYFKRELSKEDTSLIGDIKPKALSPRTLKKQLENDAQLRASGCAGSSWNASGTTYLDVSVWAKTCLTSCLKRGVADQTFSIQDNVQEETKKYSIRASASAPTKVGCEASVAVIRKKKRYMFESNFTVAFTVTAPDGTTIKGKLVYAEVDHVVLSEIESGEIENIEVNQLKLNNSPKAEHMVGAKSVIPLLENAIVQCVREFAKEFRETK